MNKGQLSKILRALGLIYLFDWSRYYYHWLRNRSKNKAFKKAHPGLALPPDYLIYESFQMDYKKYYSDSRDTAFWIRDMVADHLQLNPGDRILDWGCGPGRIIRHMPEVFGTEIEFYGTDINPRSIAWCKENLPQIDFNLNGLDAQLPYPDEHFSFIWGISIFTHLSEKLHHEWMNELKRILRPGGVLFLTTHGNNFKAIMTAEEVEAFESGKLLERAQTTEGHRTYSAFQPPSFMQDLFKDMEICTHLEREPSGSGIIPQDVWVVKK